MATVDNNTGFNQNNLTPTITKDPYVQASEDLKQLSNNETSQDKSSFSSSSFTLDVHTQGISDVKYKLTGLNDTSGKVDTANKALDGQNNILSKIENLTDKFSEVDSDDIEQRDNLQAQVTELIGAFDQIAKATTYNNENLLSGNFSDVFKSNSAPNSDVVVDIPNTSSENIGETRFESTSHINTSGTASFSFQNSENETIRIDDIVLDEENIEEGLQNLTNRINEESDTIQASFIKDEENGGGRIVLSQAGEEAIEYNLNIENSGVNRQIDSEYTSTLSLEDLSGDISEEQALSLGVNSAVAQDGIGSILSLGNGRELGNSVLGNAHSDINETKDDLVEVKKEIRVADDFFTNYQSPQNSINFANESFNFDKQNVLSQAGSFVISQTNPTQSAVLNLLK